MPEDYTEKVTLEYPPQIAEGPLSVLGLRRPNAGDVIYMGKLDGDAYEVDVAMASRLSKFPRDIIEQIDYRDFSKVQEKLAGFFDLGQGQKKSATGS